MNLREFAVRIKEGYANLREKHVIAAAVGMAFVICLFPPWRMDIPQQGISASLGYSFLLVAPNPLARIDSARLLVQIVLVGIGAGGALLALSWGRR